MVIILPVNVPSRDISVPRLKSTVSLSEILEAMKHPLTGVGFMVQTVSLPSNAFVSIDAIQWIINHVEGVTDIEKAKAKMEVR